MRSHGAIAIPTPLVEDPAELGCAVANVLNLESLEIKMTEDEEFGRADELYDQQRYDEAYAIFLGLAESGYLAAYARVALMLFTGEGVTKNWDKSIEWDMRARDRGDSVGTFNLAMTCVELGRYDEARQYFEECSVAGDGDADFEIAKLLLKHFNMKEQALVYLDRAISSGRVTESAQEEAAVLKKELLRSGEGAQGKA